MKDTEVNIKQRATSWMAILGFVLVLALLVPLAPQYAAQATRATRFAQNPLITVDTSGSLGGNVNGPTVIRVPDWVNRPLGRYYMYFANHMGEFIRLAYADAITGPWRVYEPGVLHVRDTAFFRPQPDPKETLADFYTHVASPESFVDPARKRLVMWVPRMVDERRAMAERSGQSARLGHAEGIRAVHAGGRVDRRHTFRGATAHYQGQSYLRVFQHDGYFYGLSRLGQLARSKDPLASFEIGPNPFREARTPTGFAMWGSSCAGAGCMSSLRPLATRLSVF